MASLGSYEAIFTLRDKISSKLDGITKATNTFNKKVDKSQDSLKKWATSFTTPARQLENLNGKLKGASVALEHYKSKYEQIGKLGDKIKGIGQGLTVGLTLPIVGLGGAMVKSAADMEAMQQQLSTMLGSEMKGAEMFDKIKVMAAKTPFGTKDLMSATNTMLGFGIAEKKVLPLMQQLGDISGGNADRFQSLALAFSQVSAAGKLQGQDLLQMINAGFNPLEAIAKRTGKTVGYWKEQMSKGAVTVEMVEQAMKDATSEGGRFYQMMEKQSKTALGQWSTFQDNLNQVLADFGQIILPYAIKGLQKLSKSLEWFQGLTDKQKKMILVFGGFLAVLGPILTAFGGLISTVSTLIPLLQAISVTGPAVAGTIGTITAAVGAATFAFAAWAVAIERTKSVLAEWGDSTKGMDEKLKINNLNTDILDTSSLEKLQYQRKQMGDKAFEAQNKELFKTLKQAEKSGRISKEGSPMGVSNINRTTNYNYNTTTNNYGLGGFTRLGSPAIAIAN